MAYKSLRDFIVKLEEDGELVRVSEPVSTYLEMTEIGRRLVETGPAVLFENVIKEDGTKSDMPVLINLFSKIKRVAMGVSMGGTTRTTAVELREVGELLAALRQPEPPKGMKDALSKLPIVKTAMTMKPKSVKRAPCQEIVLKGEAASLDILPIQTCWPGEPAPLITWPLVVTKGPSDDPLDGYNLGIYRMQKRGPREAVMRWLKHRGGAQHHARWKDKKPEPLPVAIVIGADPGTILAAVTPVPETLSEYQFAGLLRGEKLELVDCKTVPLKVPAHAEIILEGHVMLDEYADEGPYGITLVIITVLRNSPFSNCPPSPCEKTRFITAPIRVSRQTNPVYSAKLSTRFLSRFCNNNFQKLLIFGYRPKPAPTALP